MIFGVSHVDFPTTDLARTRRLFIDVLGFNVRREAEGVLDIDTGAVVVRALEVPVVEGRVSLRVQARDVEQALAKLVGAGLKAVRSPERNGLLELVASARDVDGHSITVWRELTEDEFGFDVPLPKQATWSPDSEALMKELLRGVPALFRGLARRKVVREVEALATSSGVLGREEVIRGFILSNARVTRFRARTPLEKAGIDPARYAADFDAP